MRGDVAWKYAIARIRPGDLGAKGAQAICCGFDVPVGLAAHKICGLICEGSADQIPVGKGFGWNNGKVAPE